MKLYKITYNDQVSLFVKSNIDSVVSLAYQLSQSATIPLNLISVVPIDDIAISLSSAASVLFTLTNPGGSDK